MADFDDLLVFKAFREVIDEYEQFFTSLDRSDLSENLLAEVNIALRKLAELLIEAKKEASSPSALDEVAALASAFDNSGDASLQKQAAVLDEILLTIGASKRQVAEMKAAHEREIAHLRALAEEKKESDPYTVAKAEHDKQNKVSEVEKAYKEKVKEYRPMEAPLMTRTCPDHPGAQMSRVAENTFQCSMDKAIYNFQYGYTTQKGNKVPGGNVSEQTQAHDRTNEITSFDTRESRLNQV